MHAMQLKVAGVSILENKPPPPTLEVHLKILKAIEHVNRATKEDNALGRKLYEEAIELNPEYASTYRLLGWTYFHDASYGWSESHSESLEKAEKLANKAFSLGDDGFYILLAQIYIWKGQHDRAVAIGEKGLAINSNWANYNAVFANVLSWVGRYEEALVLIKKAMRLNPHYPSWYLFYLGAIYINAERYNEAVPVLKKYTELTPGDLTGYLFLIQSYIPLGREKEARESASEVLKLNPKYSIDKDLSAVPFKNEEEKARVINSLRKAGLN